MDSAGQHEGIDSQEESGHVIFQKYGGGTNYQITTPDFDEQGVKLESVGRLVRIGTSLFIDLAGPEMGTAKNITFPYPAIEGHVFGRVFLEQDRMHIDFLSDKWVSDQAKTRKLTLPSVTIGERTVLTATTEELRKFALEHAEDKDAFSEAFAFQRKK